MTILVIARNTFREGIRAKVLYALVFFAVVMIFFSYFMGQLTLGENLKVMMDLGLSFTSLFGVLIAIFVGIGLIYKELEKRTVYTLLSKPLYRHQFIFGKYFGLCFLLLTQLIAMWILFSLVLYGFSQHFFIELLPAGLCIYLELMVITAVAIFFSSFSSPFLSAMFTISFYIIGHCTSELAEFGKKVAAPLGPLLQKTTIINLDHFNIISDVVHGMTISSSRILSCIGYAASLVTLVLFAGALIFSRRDFK